jgi:hypothetical protein
MSSLPDSNTVKSILKKSQPTPKLSSLPGETVEIAPKSMSAFAAALRAQVNLKYLYFIDSNEERDFLIYYSKFHSGKWKVGVLSVLLILTLYYVFGIASSVGAENLDKISIPCLSDTFCGYSLRVEGVFWLGFVVFPNVILYCFALQPREFRFYRIKQPLTAFIIGVQVLAGIGVRNIFQATAMSLVYPTILMTIVSPLGLYLTRTRFLYTLITQALVFSVWLIIIISCVLLLPAHYSYRSTIFCILPILLSITFSSICSYDMEYFYRMQYLMSKEMKKTNSKLTNQLKVLSKSYNKEAGSLETPLEKSVMVVRSVMADPLLSAQHLMALGQVMSLLASSNLLTPDFEEIHGLADSEQQAWLVSEIAGSRFKTSTPDTGAVLTQLVRKTTHVDRCTSLLGGKSDENPDDNDTWTIYPPASKLVADLLQQSISYDWNVFDFAKATNYHSLFVMSTHLFHQAALFESLNIPFAKFGNFMQNIENGYNTELPCNLR